VGTPFWLFAFDLDGERLYDSTVDGFVAWSLVELRR
jgi:hypothetical protein